jgi:hypothetical protein
MNDSNLVTRLLGKEGLGRQIIGEASIHRPRRGGLYVASYTGPLGGQVWKSTGTANPHLARAIAKELETAARAQRAKSTRAPARPSIYHRRSDASAPAGLTQRQVAFVLGLSFRTSMSARSHRWWSPAHPARR